MTCRSDASVAKGRVLNNNAEKSLSETFIFPIPFCKNWAKQCFTQDVLAVVCDWPSQGVYLSV